VVEAELSQSCGGGATKAVVVADDARESIVGVGALGACSDLARSEKPSYDYQLLAKTDNRNQGSQYAKITNQLR
jgi:hypothetical protein